jgi:hypothetical protein
MNHQPARLADRRICYTSTARPVRRNCTECNTRQPLIKCQFVEHFKNGRRCAGSGQQV